MAIYGCHSPRPVVRDMEIEEIMGIKELLNDYLFFKIISISLLSSIPLFLSHFIVIAEQLQNFIK